MSLSIEAVRALEGPIAGDVERLMHAAFGTSSNVTAADVLRTSASADPDVPPYYFAAYDGGQLVGFNAFMPVRFRRRADQVVAFQSCWSATHPDFQGRGIWVKVMSEAHARLMSEGAFVFGIPNPNSHPIMIRKLGYRQVPIVTTRIPAIPFAGRLFLSGTHHGASRGWMPDERLIAKSKKLGNDLVEAEIGTAYAWGRRKQRRARGIGLTYVEIGGLDVGSDPAQLTGLMKRILTDAGAYVQIVASATHELRPNFTGWRPLPGVRPFVIRDFTTAPDEPLNLMHGVTDVF